MIAYESKPLIFLALETIYLHPLGSEIIKGAHNAATSFPSLSISPAQLATFGSICLQTPLIALQFLLMNLLRSVDISGTILDI